MIEWKLYEKGDRRTEPPSHVWFIVTNGKEVFTATHQHERLDGYVWVDKEHRVRFDVTHYAEINYPNP